MLNPGAWDWGNYTGFFWVRPRALGDCCKAALTRDHQAGICFLCVIYTYFRVPEPSGRTFAELDLLFEKGIGARRFASTKVDVFDQAVDASLAEKYRDQIAMAHLEKDLKLH
jgi:MFS transporter, SP family, general alpha glucoside:H+ symporter